MPPKGRVHLFWALALMLGCHESDAPTEPRTGPPLSYSVMDPFTGSLPVGTANFPDGTLTLPTFTGITLVKISISGTTTVSPPNNFPSYPVDARGVSWAGHCTAGAWIDYYPYAWLPQCPIFDNLSPSSPVEAYTYLSGSGTAKRNGGVAGNPPPYSYSGNLSVTIAPVRAKLSLKASRYIVQPNTSVSFRFLHSGLTETLQGEHT
jgi:hypothetical protein